MLFEHRFGNYVKCETTVCTDDAAVFLLDYLAAVLLMSFSEPCASLQLATVLLLLVLFSFALWLGSGGLWGSILFRSLSCLNLIRVEISGVRQTVLSGLVFPPCRKAALLCDAAGLSADSLQPSTIIGHGGKVHFLFPPPPFPAMNRRTEQTQAGWNDSFCVLVRCFVVLDGLQWCGYSFSWT